MLAAGSPAIVGVREKAIMATRRRMRMIVAILHDGIGPVIVVMIISSHRRVIIRLGMIVGPLILVVLRAILSAHNRRNQGGQRTCCQGEDERLPILLRHANSLVESRWAECLK